MSVPLKTALTATISYCDISILWYCLAIIHRATDYPKLATYTLYKIKGLLMLIVVNLRIDS